MKKKSLTLCGGVLAAAMLTGVLYPFPSQAAVEYRWEVVNGNYYWYEDGVKQGTEGRGKEIMDPSDGQWYWLDAIDGGKKATDKEVFQESLADDAGNIGKWVRYNEKGHMIKGWYTNEKGTYFYDYTYGTMATGYRVIENKLYLFDKVTGIRIGNECSWEGINGWVFIDGGQYWYEKGVRQGTTGDRGKEIYDPGTNEWYWLDAHLNGKKAVSKDVYQPIGEAGKWAQYPDSTGKNGTGKWVRYDSSGRMIKGWTNVKDGKVTDKKYYFDLTYGTMAKGTVEIEGKYHQFDQTTGVWLGEVTAPTASPAPSPKPSPSPAPTNPTATPPSFSGGASGTGTLIGR